MSRRKRRAQALQQERERMRAKVKWDGKGEDPAVVAYLQSFAGASHQDAAEIALAMDRLLKGDQSMLNDPEQAEKVQRLRATVAKIADAERRFNENQQKFIDDAWDKVEKNRPRGAKLDETQARGAMTVQNALTLARANIATKRLRFREEIEHGPKRRVFVTGNPILTDNGLVIEPEVINIMGVRMILGPGEHDLPAAFAARYEDMKRSRAENAARSKALEENLRADQLEKRWYEIDNQYGGVTDPADRLGMPGEMR